MTDALSASNSTLAHIQAAETEYQAAVLRDRLPEKVLLLGADKNRLQASLTLRSLLLQQARSLPADVLGDPLCLPWQEQLFDCAIAAHLPEIQSDSLRLLMELYRIVKPQGCLLISAAQPDANCWITGKRLPEKSPYISWKALLRTAQSCGWQLEDKYFIRNIPVRLPLPYWQTAFRKCNIPLFTSSYILILSKQTAALHPLPERGIQTLPEWSAALTAASRS